MTSDVSGAVKAAKCGRVDFKIDKTAIVHVGLGKVCISIQKKKRTFFLYLPFVGTFISLLGKTLRRWPFCARLRSEMNVQLCYVYILLNFYM